MPRHEQSRIYAGLKGGDRYVTGMLNRYTKLSKKRMLLPIRLTNLFSWRKRDQVYTTGCFFL